MPTNKEVTSNRDRYTERLKAKYPDREFADDEALFGQINDDYDNYDRELASLRENERAFGEFLASNPNSAAFLMDWRNGEDPLVVLIRRFGDDFKAALEDPAKQEALAAANKEYAARIAQENEYEELYQKNITDTYATIEQVQQEDGLSDVDIDRAMEFLIGIMKDGLLGKFTADSIRMAFKAINHDIDVQQADREGEIRGRNTKIEEKLRRAPRTDGTADLAGKNGGGGEHRPMPDLGALDRNYGSKNIWERGGEKRRSINR